MTLIFHGCDYHHHRHHNHNQQQHHYTNFFRVGEEVVGAPRLVPVSNYCFCYNYNYNYNYNYITVRFPCSQRGGNRRAPSCADLRLLSKIIIKNNIDIYIY